MKNLLHNIQSRRFAALIILLIIIGIITRLEPLHDEQRLLKSISEDGYLMMTIARNMALGLGMSTADGTIPTNGTQPLTTFLWAGAYWLEGGDKVQTLIWIILMQFMFASLTAFLLWQFGRQVLQQRPNSDKMASLAAATWYASPAIAPHTINGLETGLYGLAVLWVTMILVSAPTKPWTLRYSVWLGLLLGITFWIRNDAAFLIFAACLMHIFIGGSWQSREISQRLLSVNVMGLTSVLVALPWLIYNQIHFGSIMPISGQSQSLGIEFGQNLPALSSTLVERFLVFLPIPYQNLPNKLPFVLAYTVFLLGIIVMLPRLWSQLQSPKEHRLFVLVSLSLLVFCGFYGLYFGASYFLDRYFLLFSPFFALLWAAIVVWAWQAVPWQVVRYGFTLLFITAILGFSVRHYHKGHQQAHFQFVEWVQQHVTKDDWVGAEQTGTLGYFYNRTMNLDGKVNPEALSARKREEMFKYAIDKQIEYLVDWVWIIDDWLNTDDPTLTKKQRQDRLLLKQHFELIVRDTQRNLAVLKRRTTVSVRFD